MLALFNLADTSFFLTVDIQCACVIVMWHLHTSLYFCSVLASLVSQASTVALLLCRVVSRWVRSADGSEARLLSWANRAGSRIRDREDITNSSYHKTQITLSICKASQQLTSPCLQVLFCKNRCD